MKAIVTMIFAVLLCGCTTPAKDIASSAGKAVWAQHSDIAQSRAYTWLTRSHYNSKPWFVHGESLVYDSNRLVALRYHMACVCQMTKTSSAELTKMKEDRQANLIVEYSIVNQEWNLIVPERENAQPRKEKFPNQAIDSDKK